MIPLRQATSLRSLGGSLEEVILVDFSWLLHRSFHANGNLSTRIGGIEVMTGDIYGTLRSIATVCSRSPDAAIILCLDSPKESVFRFKLDPNYKTGRGDSSEVYRKQDEILAAACLIPCVYFAYEEGYEADDLIATMAQRFKPHVDVLIYGADNDVYQVLCDPTETCNSVHIFQRLAKDKEDRFEVKGPEVVREQYELEPHELVIFRSLRGDASDKLKGYPRFPAILAKAIARKFKTPEEILANIETLKSVAGTFSQCSHLDAIFVEPQKLKHNYMMMKLALVDHARVYESDSSSDPIFKYRLKSIYEEMRKIGVELPAYDFAG